MNYKEKMENIEREKRQKKKNGQNFVLFFFADRPFYSRVKHKMQKTCGGPGRIEQELRHIDRFYPHYFFVLPIMKSFCKTKYDMKY
jgi:hypothetical protein